MSAHQPKVISYNALMRSLDLPVGGGSRHRDAHGPGRAPNAWSRVGEKKDGGGAKVIGGVMLGVAVVAVAIMVWVRAKKDGG
jgi:hypothetical protein